MVAFIVFCVIGIIFLFVWMLFDDGGGNYKEQPSVSQAAMFIEIAAKFVKENYGILDCNQITMWQHGDVGEGWTIEFYGFDTMCRVGIEALVDNIIGSWEIYEDTEDKVLHITYTGKFSYTGSWAHFNRLVWNEIERKHPEWKISKPYSYKYVLYV